MVWECLAEGVLVEFADTALADVVTREFAVTASVINRPSVRRCVASRLCVCCGRRYDYLSGVRGRPPILCDMCGAAPERVRRLRRSRRM
jgi:hypothetical protein